MNPGVHIARVWEDPHLLEVAVTVSDGRSHVQTHAYVHRATLTAAAHALTAFSATAQDGTLDVELGAPAANDGNGWVRIRFLIHRGRLIVTSEQHAAPERLWHQSLAAQATLHLRSELALLDRFVEELLRFVEDHDEPATLHGIRV